MPALPQLLCYLRHLGALPPAQAPLRARRQRGRSCLRAKVIAGLAIAATTVVGMPATAAMAQRARAPATTITISEFPTRAQVLRAVQAAQAMTVPPPGVQPSLATLAQNGDFGMSGAWATCPGPGTFQSTEDIAKCTFGDVRATRTLVLTGDSRAQMWFDTLDAIASAAHFRLVLMAKSGCPSPRGNYPLNNGGNVSAAPWPACRAWDDCSLAAIPMGALRFERGPG